MKIKTLSLISVLISVVACNQNGKNQEVINQTTEKTSAKKSINKDPLNAVESFDLDRIPITSQNIGTFPYLSAPDDYKYLNSKNKKFEEKFFFYNDSLVLKVGGQYFHTQISPNESVSFEDTYLVNNYKQAIEKLGGIEIFSGGIPSKGSDLINKEKPSYVEDMYDPMPYQYKQFIVRTPDQNIWIELCHKLNATLVDLTILREEILKGSVGIIPAAKIKDQIDKSGKAILYISFDTDKSTLKDDGLKAVREISKLLENDKSLKLSIEGYTDNTGDLDHNKMLSTERANSVLEKLVSLKIEASRLKAIGHGADNPLAENDTEANRAKNRRVELVKM